MTCCSTLSDVLYMRGNSFTLFVATSHVSCSDLSYSQGRTRKRAEDFTRSRQTKRGHGSLTEYVLHCFEAFGRYGNNVIMIQSVVDGASSLYTPDLCWREAH